MRIWEMVLLGAGLSMDAFAISIVYGLGMRRFRPERAALAGFFFGGAQAAMPLLGWLLGSQFARYIQQFDHWIAFALLGFLGVKMLYGALKGPEEDPEAPDETALGLTRLLVMAIATSIDSLAVGISLAFLRVNILVAAAVIGLTTFCISFAGVAVGQRFGGKHQRKAEILGGVMLVLIGVRILLEGLGVIP